MTREQYWDDMVAKFQATTLSQAAFCLEQDIKCHNFRYWLVKLTPSAQTPSFIKLAPFSKAIPILVIEYPNGVKIHPASNTPLAELRAMINLL